MLAARERFEAQQNSLLAGSPASSPKSKDKKDKKDKDEKKDKKDKKDVPSSSASSVAGGGGGSDDPVEAAFKAALDSGEWKKKEDPSTKKTYYYNTKSKKTTWDLKKDLKKELAAKAPAPAAEPAPVQQAPAQEAPATTAQTQPPPQPTTSAPQSQPQPVPQQQPTTSAPGQPAAPTTHAYDSLPSQRQSPPPAASSSSAMTGQHFPNLSVPSYVDPVERLINHNAQLQQLIAGGSKGSVALDFQQRYDALERTNNALSVQLERLKNEHRSMAQALAEANTRIHEQQSQLAACRPTIGDRSRDEEMQLTFSHLREQNRVLITQVSELSTMLARGLNESAAKMADFNAGLSAQHDARVGSANSPANETGARLATKFLDSQARHSLCPNCVLNVTRYRDQLLSPQETNVGRLPSAAHPARDGGADAVPSYRPVSDLTQPPPSQYYSEPQPQQPQQYSSVGRSASHNTNSGFTYGVPPRSVSLGPHGNTGGASATHHAPSGDGSGGGGGSGGPAVMYGGFVIRNPSGGQR